MATHHVKKIERAAKDEAEHTLFADINPNSHDIYHITKQDVSGEMPVCNIQTALNLMTRQSINQFIQS